jgi:hypothetical protein
VTIGAQFLPGERLHDADAVDRFPKNRVQSLEHRAKVVEQGMDPQVEPAPAEEKEHAFETMRMLQMRNAEDAVAGALVDALPPEALLPEPATANPATLPHEVVREECAARGIPVSQYGGPGTSAVREAIRVLLHKDSLRRPQCSKEKENTNIMF